MICSEQMFRDQLLLEGAEISVELPSENAIFAITLPDLGHLLKENGSVNLRAMNFQQLIITSEELKKPRNTVFYQTINQKLVPWKSFSIFCVTIKNGAHISLLNSPLIRSILLQTWQGGKRKMGPGVRLEKGSSFSIN